MKDRYLSQRTGKTEKGEVKRRDDFRKKGGRAFDALPTDTMRVA